MRIAFLGDGSLGHTRRWAGYFQGEGHDCLLVSFEDVAGAGVPAKRLPTRLPTHLLGYLSALGAVRREIRIFRPDIVNALYAGGYGLVAALSGIRPYAVTCLGSDLLVDYPSSPIHRLQIGKALRSADLVITDADVLSNRAASIGVPPGRILKACMGIDEAIFHPAAGRPTDAAARVVSTRNLHPIYNLGLLLDAAPAVLERVQALFIVCGDGPERAALERKVAAAGLAGRFVFRGRLAPAEIAEELRRASVYVSTSRSDSTSVSLLEAMACGAPPVVTDLAANREWIEDGTGGIIVPCDDPRALAGAVARILSDAGLATAIRERNIRTVRERGLWKDNMRRVEKAFLEMIRNREKT